MVAGGLTKDESGDEEFGEGAARGAEGQVGLGGEVLDFGDDEAALGEGAEEEVEFAGVGGEGSELREG
jgi:hypothetical protein